MRVIPLLMLLALMLSGILVGGSGYFFWQTGMRYQAVLSVVKARPVLLHLADAAEGWANERDAVHQALLAPSAVSKQQQTLIDAARSQANGAFDAAEAALPSLSFGRKEALLQRMEGLLTEYQSLLPMAEVETALPLPRRAGDLRWQWVRVLSDLIETAEMLRADLAYTAAWVDVPLLSLSLLEREAFTMLENARRERALLHEALVTGVKGELSFPRQALTEAHLGTELSLDAIGRIAGALPEAERAAVRMEESFVNAFSPVRYPLYRAVTEGASGYRLSPDEWLDASGTALAGLAGFASDTSSLFQDRLSTLQMALTRWLAVYGAAALMGLMLLAGIVLVLVRRVATPLRMVANATSALARGNTVALIPSLATGSEWESITVPMLTLKQHLIEQEAEIEQQKRKLSEQEQYHRAWLMALANMVEKSMGEMVASIAAAATEVEQAARAASSQVHHITHKTGKIVIASDKAAKNAKSVAGAAEKVSVSTEEIAHHVAAASRLAAEAADHQGALGDGITSLARKASDVRATLSMLQDMTEQINLLALNASIAFARLHDGAEQDSAMAAGGIKELAGKNIKTMEQLALCLEEVERAAEGLLFEAGAIGETVRKLEHHTDGIGDTSVKHAAITAEIARFMQQASTSALTISDGVGTISTTAADTGEIVAGVVETASALNRQAGQLARETSFFLKEIRSGGEEEETAALASFTEDAPLAEGQGASGVPEEERELVAVW